MTTAAITAAVSLAIWGTALLTLLAADQPELPAGTATAVVAVGGHQLVADGSDIAPRAVGLVVDPPELVEGPGPVRSAVRDGVEAAVEPYGHA